MKGFKTVVIDFDVGLRNLDLIMGCERRVVYDFINVIHGEASLHQALIKGQTVRDPVRAGRQPDARQGRADTGRRWQVPSDLSGMGFEYIICDSPAGIETGALMAMHFADEALVVTNPEVSSVRDSDRILGMLGSKTRRAIEGKEPVKEHLLVTRYNPNRVEDGQMLSLEDIHDILRIDLLGVIPSEVVLQASNEGMPVIHKQGSDVSESYKDLVDRFLGHERPLRFVEAVKPGFFSACSAGGECHVLPVLPARREKKKRLGRQGEVTRSSCARAQRTQCGRARLPADLQRDLIAVISKLRQDQSRGHQGPARPRGEPRGARSQDRTARGAR